MGEGVWRRRLAGANQNILALIIAWDKRCRHVIMRRLVHSNSFALGSRYFRLRVTVHCYPGRTTKRTKAPKHEEKSVLSVPSVVAIFAVRRDAQRFSQISNVH